MTPKAEGLLHDTPLVSHGQLRRARGRLGGLSGSEWRVVEELAQRIAEAIAAELLDQAERDHRVAAALAAISDPPKAG